MVPRARRSLAGEPLRDFVAAVSVGIVDGAPLLDLDYAEDSGCDTDMNVVMTGARRLRRVQGTAEARRSRARRWTRCSTLAQRGIGALHRRAARGARVRDRMITRLVLASNNAGKLREFRRLLAPLGIEVIAQAELGIAEADEPHVDVRRERARQGAACERACASCPRWPTIPASASTRWAARRACTARATPASRKSDARNNAKLVAALAGVADRRAHYSCVLVLVRHAARSRADHRRGRWHGTIVDTPRGSGGFGYDPHFVDADTGLTGAELPLERKNELSHRGKAMRALIARLRRTARCVCDGRSSATVDAVVAIARPALRRAAAARRCTCTFRGA